MKQKGFATPILILVALLILGGLSGAYFLGKSSAPKTPVQSTVTPKSQPTQTADETANWKTYTNTKYGFSFKYPQVFTVKLTSAEQEMISIEDQNKQSFLLIIYNNPNSLSLKDYEKKNTGESGMGPNIYYKNAELIKFQNFEAYYNKEEISCFSKCGSYVWVNKDKIYKLTGSSQNQSNQKIILDNILSTFKFLDTK